MKPLSEIIRDRIISQAEDMHCSEHERAVWGMEADYVEQIIRKASEAGSVSDGGSPITPPLSENTAS